MNKYEMLFKLLAERAKQNEDDVILLFSSAVGVDDVSIMDIGFWGDAETKTFGSAKTIDELIDKTCVMTFKK